MYSVYIMIIGYHLVFCKMKKSPFFLMTLIFGIISGISMLSMSLVHAVDQGWPVHGATPEGTRYSPLTQINRSNVDDLEIAWQYRTGEMALRGEKFAQSKDQNIPVTIAGNLVVCTPFNRVIALDPASGRERWVFDPDVSMDLQPPAPYACRGVAAWVDDSVDEDSACHTRVIFGTNDLRIFAIDARTGQPCPEFGGNGWIAAPANKPQAYTGEIRYLMPPAIINDTLVIGSAIMDSRRFDTPSGKVQAFSTRTGARLWEFDPIPKDPDDPAMATWGADSAYTTGSGNVWGNMAVDERRNLVFLPTSSAAPDYYGGLRKGNNEYTDSLVALDGTTGKVVWHYQVLHHDIWDYDIGSQPLLVDIPVDGEQVPVVVQNTKQGMVFVFHRETGEPIFPIEERAVPQGDVPGEWYSPTQPFPVKPPPLISHRVTPEDAWGFTFWDRNKCRDKIESLRHGTIYTPISLQGTAAVPWNGGGANWGGPAFDPERNLMVINTNRIAEILQLVPIEEITKSSGDEATLDLYAARPMEGTPYALKKAMLLSPLGAPCTPPPWGGLTAVDLSSGTIVWDVTLGSLEEWLPIPLPLNLGVPGMGGPIITAGGLIFIAATFDRNFRAFDIKNGEELWRYKLPAGSQTTPITYSVDGRQYIVLTSGGHGQVDNKRGDYVLAFALPDKRY